MSGGDSPSEPDVGTPSDAGTPPADEAPVEPDVGVIQRTFDRVAAVTVDATSTIMLLLLGIVLWMGVGRSLFNMGQPWLDELARYLQIWLVYLAAFELTLRGDHITMDAVYVRLPDRVRYGVRLATGVVTLAMALVTAYYAYLQANTVWVQGETSPSGVLPAILGYASLPIGFLLIAVASVYYLAYTASEDDVDRKQQETEYDIS